MSENFVPQVRVGQRTAVAVLYVESPVTVETGKHRRILFVDSLMVEYGFDQAAGYWKWTAASARGTWGSGEQASVQWRYGSQEVPFWVVALIHRHMPELRKETK